MFNLSVQSSLPVLARRSLQAFTRPSLFRAQFLGPLAMYSTPNQVNQLVAKFKKDNPGIEGSEVRAFSKFLHLVPDHLIPKSGYPKFEKKSLPHKNCLLQMLQTPPEQLTQKQILSTLKKIGFETRKAEFLNAVEKRLAEGGARGVSTEDAEYLVQLSSKLQKAETVKELKACYQELKEAAAIAHFEGTRLLLEFLIFENASQEVCQFLQFHCVFCPAFPSRSTKHLAENRATFERSKPILLSLLSALSKSNEYFKVNPEINFQTLHETITAAENQVQIKKILYADDIRERFPLKQWGTIATSFLYRPDLYLDLTRTQDLLWFLYKDPEKAGLTLPVDKYLLQDYAKAMQVKIHWELKHNNERNSAYQHYSEFYPTTPPTLEQIRERAIQEIKGALLTGDLPAYLKRMQFHIDSSEKLTQKIALEELENYPINPN